ncbi:hypothetical protein ACJJTC_015896 [Scirpophaga incertulas]
MTEDQKKKPMTDEERLALCHKLDEELDDFINSLEKKRYTEGWPEDRWEEEMDKHPFFMKSAPDDGELSPLVEGLAKLKYDSEENTPLELATNYKEDGNFNFRHKNYRLAILGYTEGLRQKCDNAEINACLYNNRAAAQFHLQNYRSSLFDCERALLLNPNYEKARLRAAKAAFEVGKYDKCIEHCQKLGETQPLDKEVTNLLNTAKRQQMIQYRDHRKKERLDATNEQQKQQVIKAIIDRGIKIWNCDDEDDIDISILEPTFPGLKHAVVCFQDDILIWPVLLLYPEHKMTDFISYCPENIPLIDQIQEIYPIPWDKDNSYKLDTLNVYFEGCDKKPHVIDPRQKLGDIITNEYFEVKAGTPAFFLVPSCSTAETSFLNSYA